MHVHSAFIRLKWVDKVVVTHVEKKNSNDNFKMIKDMDR